MPGASSQAGRGDSHLEAAGRCVGAMTGTALYIATFALDQAVSVHCREGLSIIEMDHWWLEMWLDYGVRLTAANGNRKAGLRDGTDVNSAI